MDKLGKQLAIWGLLLQFGFLIGIVGTIVGMMRAFAEMSGSGQTTPEALASHIGLTLYTTAAGMVISLTGAVLLLIALLGAKYRALWFKTTMWVLAVLWLFIIPIGTILGIIVMVYLSKHGNEFT